MSEKLKRCPFCGGEAEYEREGTSRVSCQVSCTNCGAHHESGDSDWSNGKSWNRRPEDERLAALVRLAESWLDHEDRVKLDPRRLPDAIEAKANFRAALAAGKEPAPAKGCQHTGVWPQVCAICAKPPAAERGEGSPTKLSESSSPLADGGRGGEGGEP